MPAAANYTEVVADTMQTVFLDNTFMGEEYFVALILILISMVIITRKTTDWPLLAFPLCIIWDIVGVDITITLYLVAGIAFTLAIISPSQIGSYLFAVRTAPLSHQAMSYGKVKGKTSRALQRVIKSAKPTYTSRPFKSNVKTIRPDIVMDAQWEDVGHPRPRLGMSYKKITSKAKNSADPRWGKVFKLQRELRPQQPKTVSNKQAKDVYDTVFNRNRRYKKNTRKKSSNNQWTKRYK